MYLPLRPSDRDRVRAIDVLKRGYVTGRLSTETLEERVAVAHATRSRATLRALLSDVSAAWMAASTLIPAGRGAPAVEITPQATMLLSRIARERVIVGRARGCDLVFGSDAVSRRHAVFERVGTQWHVSDLGSMNGTFVDGVRVDRAPVTAGAAVRLGDSLLSIA